MQIFLEEQENNKTDIVRPNISLKETLFPHIVFILGYAALFVGSCILISAFELPHSYVFFPTTIVFALIVIRAKKTIVDAILIYQQYAPERIRAACVFTPTCSNYMLLSISKYGTVKGVIKGINRLLRCHYPNGGEDYP